LPEDRPATAEDHLKELASTLYLFLEYDTEARRGWLLRALREAEEFLGWEVAG
jgi:hypothetical protein